MVLSRQIALKDLGIDGMLGLTPWRVSLGHSSFLTMQFGKEVIKTLYGKSHIYGEWHLWLQCCSWRIQARDRILVASGDALSVIERCLGRVTFGPLDSVRVDGTTLDLTLAFQNGIELVAFTNNRYRYTQWDLFKPDGEVLTANAGGRLTREPAGGEGRGSGPGSTGREAAGDGQVPSTREAGKAPTGRARVRKGRGR